MSLSAGAGEVSGGSIELLSGSAAKATGVGGSLVLGSRDIMGSSGGIDITSGSMTLNEGTPTAVLALM